MNDDRASKGAGDQTHKSTPEDHTGLRHHPFTPHASPLSLPESRPTWAEINLDNLIHNFRVMKAAVGPDTAIMPAVKADAYGHGAVDCARELERAGADWFGVALPEEGLKLRDADISRPVLCLGGFWEGQEELVVRRGLTPVVFRLDLLERLDGAALAAGASADYHLKIDTGMGRLGVPHAELADFLDGAARFQNVKLDGVMTHLASADEPDKVEFTERQMSLFERAVGIVRDRGHRPTWVHVANSAASHAYPRARGNLVRIGGVMYGLWRDVTRPDVKPLDWRPVMSLHTRIALIKTVPQGTPLGYGGTFVTSRESLIATLPIGYEDGLRRGLSNRGRVIVRGRFAPIVGRVSMDLTIVDVTGVVGVTTGDEVVIIGSQGMNQISAEEVAASLETISYEITCAVSDRVPRVTVGGGR
ncbi:MAG TPA: alanine racemase [Blastocatellia bacterium]|jgi:alanine racemase|nr:alanine racemase [Blastocatellia bacterium]